MGRAPGVLERIARFYIIPPFWDDKGSWNLSSLKTRGQPFLHVVNVAAVNELVTQGARLSAAVVLNLFATNIPGPAWRGLILNAMWPSWYQRSWSTLVQIMACCLMAPSLYLNRCRLIISKIQWNSFESNFKRYPSHQSLHLAWKLPI